MPSPRPLTKSTSVPLVPIISKDRQSNLSKRSFPGGDCGQREKRVLFNRDVSITANPADDVIEPAPPDSIDVPDPVATGHHRSKSFVFELIPLDTKGLQVLLWAMIATHFTIAIFGSVVWRAVGPTYVGAALAVWEWLMTVTIVIIGYVISPIVHNQSACLMANLTLKRNIIRLLIITIISLLLSIGGIADGVFAIFRAQLGATAKPTDVDYTFSKSREILLGALNTTVAVLSFGAHVVLSRQTALQFYIQDQRSSERSSLTL